MDKQTLKAHIDELAGFVGVLCIILPLATIAIGLRIWIRLRVASRLGVDDCILMLSHFVNLICTAFWLYVHVKQKYYQPRSTELIDALSTPLVISIGAYVASSVLVKISIGLFFLRIAQRKWQKYVVLGPTILYTSFLIISLTIVLLRCGVPIIPAVLLVSDHCPISPRLEQILGLNIASINALCDWVFAAVPIHLLLTSQRLSPAAKFSSCFIIGLAVAGSIVSIVRLPYFADSSFGPTFFETGHMVIFLSVLETAVGAIAISLVTLKPLLQMRKKSQPKVSHVPANAVLAEGQRPLGSADWMYSACVSKSVSKTQSSKVFDLKGVRGLGVLPDVSMTETNASRDDEVVLPATPAASYRQSYTMIRIPNRIMPPIEEVLRDGARRGRESYPSVSDGTTRVGSMDGPPKPVL
ncbi:hypothetical protein BDZ85DRAFT_280785 [Elsinoe ampelina]|uniref:Rhodopsin domain-containing protein n=1 Tax=Elsinoe ampelina TaxID=302913 RepID=A0A6A6GEP4_9PEZI|nr:hypothetical protein BDZ85DRAFT_280785 [Elsinoe ampelina]